MEWAADFIRKALKEPNLLKRNAALLSMIASTPPGEIDNLVGAYNRCMAEGLPTRMIGELIHQHEGRLRGQACLGALPKEPNGVPGYDVKHRLRGWATADPAGCKAWLETLEPGRTKSDLTADWLEGLKEADPGTLQTVFPQLTPDMQTTLVGRCVEDAVQQHGLSGMAEWFRTGAAGLPEKVKARALAQAVDSFTQNQTPEGLQRTVDFLKQVAAPEDPAFATGLNQMVWRTARYSPGGTLDLLDQYLPQNEHLAGMKADFISRCVRTASVSTVNDIGDWLNHHRTSPIYNDVAGAFLTHVNTIEPEAAKAWANSITDPGVRAEMLQRLESQGAAK